jgi:hypothetical protein
MNTLTTTTPPSKSYPEHSLVFMLMGGFLLVDSLVGFIEIYLGIHLKVSLLYKSPVLLFILVVIALRDLRLFLVILAFILTFLIGPIIKLIQFADIKSFFFDITLFLKMLSPFLYMKYFMLVAKERPHLLMKHGPSIMLFNYIVIVINIILGLMGFGYSTYSGGGGASNIGVNGFFSAGNELSAVFIVLSAYILVKAMQKSLSTYLLFCLFTMGMGVLISTKTSILSSILLCILIPFAMDRKSVLKVTPLKIILTTIAFSAIVYAAILSVYILRESGLWHRIEWFYKQHGLLRVILSGREIFARDLLTIYSESSWYELLFGLSTATLDNFWLPLKASAEIDPIDVLVTFGLFGLVTALAIQLYLLTTAFLFWKTDKKSVAAAGIVSLVLLELLAFTSGHIWLSGMVGPFIGLLIAMNSTIKQKNLS